MSVGTNSEAVESPSFPPSRAVVVAQVVAITLLAFLLTRSIWIGDDAFVTLKTALNAVHGWGAGFNATEAVQGYTSPLWFLMWLFIEQTTQWSVFGILFLSLVFSVVALSIPLLSAVNIGSVIVVTSAILFSNALFDFASGGLENPLAYLLMGAVILLTRKTSHASLGHFVLLGLAASAVILTRFDLVLMIFPIGLWVFWSCRTQLRKLTALLVALLIPLVVWFVWSFSTYASILPNTYLAKTYVEIPRVEIVTQGILYLWVSLSEDPVTLLLLVSFLAFSFLSRETYMILWAVGVLAYVLYVVWVGGDYMAGRFLSVPVFVAIVLLVTRGRYSNSKLSNVGSATRHSRPSLIVGLLVSVLALTFLTAVGKLPTSLDPPGAPRWDHSRTFGVADEVGSVAERGWTLAALMESQLNPSAPKNNWLAVIAVSANEWPEKTDQIEYPVDIWGPDCAWIADGITLGPLTHQILDCPLTDRFLAELSFRPGTPFGWRPGHLVREVPGGYVDAVRFGDPSLVEDPDEAARLRDLWESIQPAPK